MNEVEFMLKSTHNKTYAGGGGSIQKMKTCPTSFLKKKRLDFGKCVGFGSNGASIMIDKQNGITACLKRKVNSFLTSIHWMAHRTNLVAINTSKVGPCKDMSKKINTLLNSVSMYFKKSCKKMHCFDCKKKKLILQSVWTNIIKLGGRYNSKL